VGVTAALAPPAATAGPIRRRDAAWAARPDAPAPMANRTAAEPTLVRNDSWSAKSVSTEDVDAETLVGSSTIRSSVRPLVE
jgi:hypothetical protein